MNFEINKAYTFFDRRHQKYVTIVPKEIGDTYMVVEPFPTIGERHTVRRDLFEDKDRFERISNL